MTEHDESLEVGIAAGLDVPTAIVIMERADDQTSKHLTRKPIYNRVVLVAFILGLAVTIFCGSGQLPRHS